MSLCNSPRYRQDCRKNFIVRLGQLPFNVNGWMKGRMGGWMMGWMDGKLHFVPTSFTICNIQASPVIYSPLWQLQQLLLFLLLLLVALLWCLLNAAKGGNWLHPSIVLFLLLLLVALLRHLLNAAKGNNYLHRSIAKGGMDGRVDEMKKASFHHDHDILYIY